MNNNPYKILGIDEKAEFIVIKAAYRAMANKYHPDKWQGDKKEAEEKIKEINNAYDILSNENKKREYDKSNTSSQQRQKTHKKQNKKNEEESSKTKYSPPNFYPQRSDANFIFPVGLSNLCSKISDKFIWVLIVFGYFSCISSFSNLFMPITYEYSYALLNSPPSTIGGVLFGIKIPIFIKSFLFFFFFFYYLMSLHYYKFSLKETLTPSRFNLYIFKFSNNTTFIELLNYTIVLSIIISFISLEFSFHILPLGIIGTLGIIPLLGMGASFSRYRQDIKPNFISKLWLLFIMVITFNMHFVQPTIYSKQVPFDYRIDLINLSIFIFVIKFVYDICKNKIYFSKIKISFLIPILSYSIIISLDAMFFDYKFYKLLSNI